MINLDFTIGDMVNTKLKTLLIIPISSTSKTLGLDQVQVTGDLTLQQKSPLAIGSIQRYLYNETLDVLYRKYTFSQILQRISSRNQTTKFDYHVQQNSDPSSGKTSIEVNIIPVE